MHIPLFKDILINMLRVLWPKMYVVIFKMLPCHHHDTNSDSNRCTSPTSIFASQLWGYQKKDKQVKGLSKSRRALIWSLDWILSSYPYTKKTKRMLKSVIFLHLLGYILAIQSPCSLSLPFHHPRRWCNVPQASSHHTPAFDLSSICLSWVTKTAAKLYIQCKSQDTQTSLSEVFSTLKYKKYA